MYHARTTVDREFKWDARVVSPVARVVWTIGLVERDSGFLCGRGGGGKNDNPKSDR